MSESSPRVSVVIPCFNLGAYLDRAVDSVLRQTFADVEILVIDDGSTDPLTRQLFASFRRPRTRCVRTPNRGLAQARNLGLREARGELVSFLDADDVLEPHFLERTLSAFDSEPTLAFVSCWLKMFGAGEGVWRPTSCDFPRLLAEDTVCTAALMRTGAVRAAGGFDPRMPVAGYEDWDLAISLVESGLAGRIVPEVLMSYRIRAGSMSEVCCAPPNHARLLGYLIDKHADSYRRHFRGVMQVVEERIRELEVAGAGDAADPERWIADLEATLRALVRRNGSGPARRLFESRPVISAVIVCRDQGRSLLRALDSVAAQRVATEILVVDDGSTDELTLGVLEHVAASGRRVIRAAGAAASARSAGLRQARAEIVFAMGADQTLEPGYFQKALAVLRSGAEIDFVYGGRRDLDGTGFTWMPSSADLAGLAGCLRFGFPIVRKRALIAARADAIEAPTLDEADLEVALRLEGAGIQGRVLQEPFVNLHRAGARRADAPDERLVKSLFERATESQSTELSRRSKDVIVGFEMQRRLLQAEIESRATPPAPAEPAARTSIDWGTLRRLEPVSDVWGFDRGRAIDRHYIERFLEDRRTDIHGRVLEVKDTAYARAYGSDLEATDAVDIAAENPNATVIADLAREDSLPENAYDCFILTQTIHLIYDVERVIRNAFRTLRPGGVVLATLPCVSRIDYESGVDGDCWRFTAASAGQLFGRVFPAGNVEVRAVGNVLSACGFLMGLAAEELEPGELEHHDPYHPLLVCVRAEKPKAAAQPRPRPAADPARAAVLLYHRIDRPAARDRWSLCVSPDNFAAHMRWLRDRFELVRVSELPDMLAQRRLPRRAVAVSFDDGYRDNWTAATPILRETGVAATFFIAGDAAIVGESFWWEVLDAALEAARMDDEAARALHRRLMFASSEERRRVLADLAPGRGPLPAPLTAPEIAKLACESLAEIGYHGWSHRVLAGLPIELQRYEIAENMKTLGEVAGKTVRCFAYPFGGPVAADTQTALRELGITAAVTTDEAPITADSDVMALPRIAIGDWPLDEFARRISGILDG